MATPPTPSLCRKQLFQQVVYSCSAGWCGIFGQPLPLFSKFRPFLSTCEAYMIPYGTKGMSWTPLRLIRGSKTKRNPKRHQNANCPKNWSFVLIGFLTFRPTCLPSFVALWVGWNSLYFYFTKAITSLPSVKQNLLKSELSSWETHTTGSIFCTSRLNSRWSCDQRIRPYKLAESVKIWSQNNGTFTHS